MSVSRSALAIREPERVSSSRGHGSLADLVYDIRYVGEGTDYGARIALHRPRRLRLGDVVDDALHQLQTIRDRKCADRAVDLIDIGVCHGS